jgi:hypothetical protein
MAGRSVLRVSPSSQGPFGRTLGMQQNQRVK